MKVERRATLLISTAHVEYEFDQVVRVRALLQEEAALASFAADIFVSEGQ
jgi:hypothetical protein